MIVPILKYGAPELRKASDPVESFNSGLEEIVENMLETMYSASGVGLAAPQIGMNIQLAVIDTSSGEDEEKVIVLCNPEIVSTDGAQSGEEGCLSFPGFSETVTRPMNVAVKGLNIKGEEIQIESEGLLARCFCHEIDHLNGVLFIDHISSLKRGLIKNKIRKLTKAGEW